MAQLRFLRAAACVFPLAFGLAHGLAAQKVASNPFLEAGIPASDREWHGPDYTRTSEILSAGKVALPRLSEPLGAALLGRLTSTENFSLDRNGALPIEARLGDYLAIQQGTNKVLNLYVATMVRGEAKVTAEMTQIVAFSLRVSALGIDLVEEFLPKIPKDESYAARMEGLKQMYSGISTQFQGAEAMLGEIKIYSQPERSLLLDAMAGALPVLRKAFSQDFRVELRKKLEDDRSLFSSSQDLDRLQSMIRELGG
ncbi:MAG: hypothetical protein ABUT39_20545 [Acidobacteriota bacterium]